MATDARIEKDSMGDMQIPAGAYWGAQTQRAVENFPISGVHFPRPFIRALGLIKQAAARVNQDLNRLDEKRAGLIDQAAQGMQNVIAAARLAGVRRVVITSSSVTLNSSAIRATFSGRRSPSSKAPILVLALRRLKKSFFWALVVPIFTRLQDRRIYSWIEARIHHMA